jgi:hypothetical protein
MGDFYHPTGDSPNSICNSPLLICKLTLAFCNSPNAIRNSTPTMRDYPLESAGSHFPSGDLHFHFANLHPASAHLHLLFGECMVIRIFTTITSAFTRPTCADCILLNGKSPPPIGDTTTAKIISQTGVYCWEGALLPTKQ